MLPHYHRYPQNTAIESLQSYINLGSQLQRTMTTGSALTSQITGAINWRKEGLTYKKNEVHIGKIKR